MYPAVVKAVPNEDFTLAIVFDNGEQARIELPAGRSAWLHVALGRARVNGHDLEPGDGVAIENEEIVAVEGIDGGEIVLWDLP